MQTFSPYISEEIRTAVEKMRGEKSAYRFLVLRLSDHNKNVIQLEASFKIDSLFYQMTSYFGAVTCKLAVYRVDEREDFHFHAQPLLILIVWIPLLAPEEEQLQIKSVIPFVQKTLGLNRIVGFSHQDEITLETVVDAAFRQSLPNGNGNLFYEFGINGEEGENSLIDTSKVKLSEEPISMISEEAANNGCIPFSSSTVHNGSSLETIPNKNRSSFLTESDRVIENALAQVVAGFETSSNEKSGSISKKISRVSTSGTSGSNKSKSNVFPKSNSSNENNKNKRNSRIKPVTNGMEKLSKSNKRIKCIQSEEEPEINPSSSSVEVSASIANTITTTTTKTTSSIEDANSLIPTAAPNFKRKSKRKISSPNTTATTNTSLLSKDTLAKTDSIVITITSATTDGSEVKLTLRKGSNIAVRSESGFWIAKITKAELIDENEIFVQWYGEIKDEPHHYALLEWHDRIKVDTIVHTEVQLTSVRNKGLWMLSEEQIHFFQDKL